MIAIVDYGVGNLFSLKSSFAAIGAEVTVTADSEVIKAADRIILPGVGAFGDAAEKLKSTGLGELLISEAENGKPLMGICLGMQLLFDKSFEYGCHEGLGLIKGSIKPLSGVIEKDLKIPHIGWNALNIKRNSPILKYIKNGDCVYFVHSYYATDCEDAIIADTDYSVAVTAAVQSGNIYGCQFHPEKSGDVGLSILKAFAEL